MSEIIKKNYVNDIMCIERFMKERPDAVGVYCYGIEEKMTKKLYHLIIVVDDIWKWQMQNNKEFNEYFNMLIELQYEYVDFLNIKSDNFLVDYTLISTNAFKDYLENWTNFTIASRLHRPFFTIKSNNDLNQSIKRNQDSALLLALLMIRNNQSSFYSVMEKLYSLSYNDLGIIVDAITSNYQLLKCMYEDSKYFEIASNDNILVNRSAVNCDIKIVPFDIIKQIKQQLFGLDFSQLYKYLQEKMCQEQTTIGDMQLMINGLFKTFIHSKKHQSISTL